MPAYYSPLEHEALLQVHGPDAATFLQGQATCDVRDISEQRGLPGAWCTPQGRMLADFLLVQTAPEHYTLRLRADIADTTAERLGKYIVFSKAEMTRPQNWRVIACWGGDAGTALKALTGVLPDQRYGCTSGEGFCLIQVDEAGEQFELYLDGSARADLLEALDQSLETQSPNVWQALQIDKGIGRVEAHTVETFLPQALSYDLTGFVSFTKGCYTGQEVVARLHYRGTPKRRLYRASLPSGAAPAAGESVFAGDRNVGTVVNAAAVAAGDIRLLVSLAVKSADSPLHIGSRDGPALRQVSGI